MAVMRWRIFRDGSRRHPPTCDAARRRVEYGVSRPTYYLAKGNFEAAGIAGLVPSKQGPRSPHKIGEDVLAFLQEQLVPGEPVRARALAKLVRRDLAVSQPVV